MKHQWMAFAILVVLSAPLKADLVCPNGSLSDLLPNAVWARYSKTSAGYIKSLHLLLSRDLKAILDQRNTSGRAMAAIKMGANRTIVMERMFEQGFIAATDIINAHCVTREVGEPWSQEIKRDRQRRWCREWGEAHFC